MNIIIKTPAEIKLMRQSADILKKAQQAMQRAIAPGVSMRELDTIAENIIRENGGIPAFKGQYDFPNTICAMRNEEVVHGIPSGGILQNGDLVSIDCGVIYKGWYSDAAFSLVIGGETANPERETFQKTVYEALQNGCKAARAGNTLGDIGHAIQSTVEGAGYSLCKEFTGHGLGKTLHEDPHVYNYGRPGTGARLKEGMTLCIEPIVAMGSGEAKTLDDGWMVVTADGSDACQWEHCGVVTAHGLDIFA